MVGDWVYLPQNFCMLMINQLSHSSLVQYYCSNNYFFCLYQKTLSKVYVSTEPESSVKRQIAIFQVQIEKQLLLSFCLDSSKTLGKSSVQEKTTLLSFTLQKKKVILQWLRGFQKACFKKLDE